MKNGIPTDSSELEEVMEWLNDAILEHDYDKGDKVEKALKGLFDKLEKLKDN